MVETIEQRLKEEQEHPLIKKQKELEFKKSLIPFHKFWLTQIKKTLGSKCTYISHLQEKEEFFIKVHLKNESEGIDRITFKLEDHPDRLNTKFYTSLLDNLKNGDYEQGSTEVLPSTKG